MSVKQSFAEQIKAQSDVWKVQIKEYQDQFEQARAKSQSDQRKAISQMEEMAAEAFKLFQQVQTASETAWKDMHAANQKALAELQKGWADALSRFNN